MAVAVATTGVVAVDAAAPPAYADNCQVCHGADGAGMPGQFPRLAGRVGTIAATPAGRTYLIEVLLSGMGGRIVIDGRPVIGVMPAFARLSDADIAATLNHAAQLGGGKKTASFTVPEVKGVRVGRRLNAGAIKTLRDGLVASGALP